MVKVSHEVPICLLNKSRDFNDYDYCLPHLLDENLKYRRFFEKSKSNGRYIIETTKQYYYEYNDIY